MRFLKLISILVLVTLSGCKSKSEIGKVRSFSFSGMGTVLSVSYIGNLNQEMEQEIRDSVGSLTAEMNYYDKKSFVSRINSSAHEFPQEVPPYLCKLIRKSIFFARQTAGKFDITYKSSGKLWDIHRNKVPDESEVRKLLPLVGIDNLEADCKNSTIRFKRRGVKIDLGGIAKGYAIDVAGSILEKYGVKNFIVNFGGDLLVCGKKGDVPWTVGVMNPLKKRELLKKINLKEDRCAGIATSGDYERFVEKDGKRFSHIIDPENGMPVEGAHSVTVIAENAVSADALATAVSVVHADEGFVKKIVDKFDIVVYTLTGKNMQWREYHGE